ncbi:hypothetical protein C0992_008083 [Termitomyces sp. T32_za158]|nr:hypothetical protein C0992_008083 [Termitomyces sp. T32_za158]
MERPSTSASSLAGIDGDHHADSLFRRSLHVVGDILSPFSAAAVASLPKIARPQRYTRADAIPDALGDEDGQMPTVRDYHAINSLPPKVRIPKKIATPIKVEAKVWFANERSKFQSPANHPSMTLFSAWVSWLNISILLGTLALALFNASKDEIATRFAYGYAIISICVLVRLFCHS